MDNSWLSTYGMGECAPIDCQQVLLELLLALGNAYKNKELPYMPLPAIGVKYPHDYKTPDLVLYDEENGEYPLVIYLANAPSVREGKATLKAIIESGYFGTFEAFLYDYDRQVWHRLGHTQNSFQETSHSILLKSDLANLLSTSK